jgi:hypothetical protein
MLAVLQEDGRITHQNLFAELARISTSPLLPGEAELD